MTAEDASDVYEKKPDLNMSLFSWHSPSHPFKKRNRIFYQTIAALTFLLVVIVFFLKEILLIGVILSVAFVVYVISTVPPVDVEHKIIPLGFTDAGKLYRWQELVCFWFEERWGFPMVVIQTRIGFPGQVRAVVREEDKSKIKEIIGKYLQFSEKPLKSFGDEVTDWIGKRIPMETDTSSNP
jgi:hypothetical protein